MADDGDAAAKRRRRRSTGMGGMSALPDHLQHEVFSRVGDVKSLFKLAATCRGWLRRFTDRAFLRELCPSPQQGSGLLLGVVVQDKWFNRMDKAMVRARMTTMAALPQQRASSSALAPVFLPALGSPLGPTSRALTSFFIGGGGGTFDYAEPLAARRGIVLLWLAPRTPEEMDCHLLGVCNLVTGDRHVLPPLQCSRNGKLVGCRQVVGYAIITAADESSRNGRPPPRHPWTFSQLLVITQDGDCPLRFGGGAAYLHSYSAATRRWSTPTRCLDRSAFSLVDARSTVDHHGAAHWLCIDDGRLPNARGGDHHLYRLSVDVATASVSLTRLPVRVGGKQLLCVNSDGKLAVASVYPLHVTVWTQPAGAGDDGDGDTTAAAWPRTSFRIAPQQNEDHERWCNSDHGSSSLLALFMGRGVFVLDLDTKVMEKVFILDFNNKTRELAGDAKQYLRCVPYEMDLVEFFTLQLGGIRERLGTTTISETESP
jgi:hypothetical protein